MEIKSINDVEGIIYDDIVVKQLVSGEMMSCDYFKLPPGAEAAPHAHPAEGILYCLSGELEATVGDEMKVISSGISLLVPFNVKIGLKNSGSVPAEVIVVGSPAGVC